MLFDRGSMLWRPMEPVPEKYLPCPKQKKANASVNKWVGSLSVKGIFLKSGFQANVKFAGVNTINQMSVRY